MGASTETATTLIRTGAADVTVMAFLHVDEAVQARAVDVTVRYQHRVGAAPGNIAVNVLRSLDGSRILVYNQWESEHAWLAAEQETGASELRGRLGTMLQNDGRSRLYTVVYSDDRSPDGVSVISSAYSGAIFVNEITTRPDTQQRLLELVISNNEVQSLRTPGYRSANFHRSTDGMRAVNYSLWDSQEHCIEAISAMADMDNNLEETVQIAMPDFRFYSLVHASHN